MGIPGVGTFYDFQSRLWLADAPHLSSKVRKPKRKPKKGKKGEKAPLRKPGIVGRLVSRFLKHPPAHKTQPYDLLQKIFKDCFVLPSANQGLLGDLKNLRIAGDGSSVRTGASRYGKMICSCREQNIFKCQCARRYSDPDASWGWDSYRDEYYYGRGLYAFTASDSPFDLPVYLNLFKAERHDSVAFIPSFFELIHLYPEFKFKDCLLDSAHDAYGIYKLLHQYDVGVIATTANATNGGVRLLAKSGRLHVRLLVLLKNTAGFSILMNKITLDSLLVSPEILSNGKLLTNVRTTVERYFKRLKEDYHLESKGKIRSSRAWYIRVFLASMCLHIDAWVKHQELDMTNLITQWANNSNLIAA